MKEHRLIERMVKIITHLQLEISEVEEVDSNFIDTVVDFFKTYADRCHHGKEEDILFKKLATKNLKRIHKTIMDELIQEHAYARKTVAKLKETNITYRQDNKEAIWKINDLLKELSTLYPKHIEKEDKHFFYPCMEYFSKSELESMLDDFWEFDRQMIYEKYEKIVAKKEETKPKVNKNMTDLQKYECSVCGYIYNPEKGDPEHGIKSGTKFEDLPDDWVCPVCFAPKKAFKKIQVDLHLPSE